MEILILGRAESGAAAPRAPRLLLLNWGKSVILDSLFSSIMLTSGPRPSNKFAQTFCSQL